MSLREFFHLTKGRWGGWIDRTMLAVSTYGILWAARTLIEVYTVSHDHTKMLQDQAIQIAGMYHTSDAKRDFNELSMRVAHGDVKDDTHDARLNVLEKNQHMLVNRVDRIERVSIGPRMAPAPKAKPPAKQPVKEPEE